MLSRARAAHKAAVEAAVEDTPPQGSSGPGGDSAAARAPRGGGQDKDNQQPKGWEAEAAGLREMALAAEKRGNNDFAEACRKQADDVEAKAKDEEKAASGPPSSARYAENAAAKAHTALEKAKAAAAAAQERFEAAQAERDSLREAERAATETYNQKLRERDEARRLVAAAAPGDPEHMSLPELEVWLQRTRGEMDRLQRALATKKGVDDRDGAALALTDADGQPEAPAATKIDERCAREAAKKAAGEFVLYFKTQGGADDPDKQQEMLGATISRCLQEAVASATIGGAVLAKPGGDEDGRRSKNARSEGG